MVLFVWPKQHEPNRTFHLNTGNTIVSEKPSLGSISKLCIVLFSSGYFLFVEKGNTVCLFAFVIYT